ncbi:MAG: aldolase catalytic domain-containing protein [Fusobacteriaceae bacterium]
MNVEILDCTLRDGGYINNWDFSSSDIKGITRYLNSGKIDKIELGYLTEKSEGNGTIFNSFHKIKEINIPSIKKIIMINFGEFSEDKIPESKNDIFGIRVVFKKSQWKDALKYSLNLKDKGYNIFLQPMQTISYKDSELLELIEKANEISPYSLYIVDSFGEMKKEDLLRIISLYSHNLSKDIKIGFHSHNNLQLSFALGIEFLSCNIEQGKIIDSSVYGMGRGAGNLNTELLAEHMNKYYSKDYEVENFLKIMDLYLEKIYQKEKWGYNLGHFISAKLGCHPNYASYLLDKRNIGVEAIKLILKNIPEIEKSLFNKELVESEYLNYQKKSSENYSDINSINLAENLLIIAPGLSVVENQDFLNEFINKTSELSIISLNHKNIFIKSDYLFFSNEKRFEEFSENYKKKEKIILVSNIKRNELADYIVDYNNYTKNLTEILSTEILFNIIEENKIIKKVYIAGMDGYSRDRKNYYFDTLDTLNIEETNRKIKSKLKSSNKFLKFLTKSIYMEVE